MNNACRKAYPISQFREIRLDCLVLNTWNKKKILRVNGAFKLQFFRQMTASVEFLWFSFTQFSCQKSIHILNKFLLQKIVDSDLKHLLGIHICCNPSSKLMAIKAVPRLNMM